MEIFLIASGLVGVVLAIVFIAINSSVVGHVCMREGRPFPVLWLYDTYWCSRVFSSAWMREAQAAGHYKSLIIYFCVAFCFIAICIVLIVGGLVAPRPPLIQR